MEADFHEAVMNGMLSFLLFAGALHVKYSKKSGGAVYVIGARISP